MTDRLVSGVTCRLDSEVGTLRKVLVHRPGLEHTRLTPSNAADLLFGDVIWVKRAKEEHDAFCSGMRDRGVEVYEVQGAAGRDAGDPRRARLASRPGCSTNATWARISPGGGLSLGRGRGGTHRMSCRVLRDPAYELRAG